MRQFAFVLIVALAGCASNQAASAPSASPSAAAAHTPAFSALQNGRAIYTTGRDLDGHRLTASPPPMRSACIQCHLPSGAGGLKFPDGAVSADLRHQALVTDQKPPYTIPLLERAISTGIDNDGDRLDRVMPRWRMSKRDLHDVALYVYRHFK